MGHSTASLQRLLVGLVSHVLISCSTRLGFCCKMLVEMAVVPLAQLTTPPPSRLDVLRIDRVTMTFSLFAASYPCLCMSVIGARWLGAWFSSLVVAGCCECARRFAAA